MKMDKEIEQLHHEISSEINCLECGNCCRSLGPMILEKDIDVLSKSQRMKPSDFMEKYLRKDEDGDFVFQSMPCPFLGSDNYCSVYENRPKACREYPHTDRKKFYQIYELTVKNASACPIAFGVLDRLTKLCQLSTNQKLLNVISLCKISMYSHRSNLFARFDEKWHQFTRINQQS